MLEKISNDILIKIILYEPYKIQYISKYFYNIIHKNKQLSIKIIEKYYNNFNLYNIIPFKEICYEYTKYIKNISIFFDNNLSINEKKILKTMYYITPKRYYWFNIIYKNIISIYKYINFFILYYNITEYDKLVQKLNIYVENNYIISIEIPLTHLSIKYFILYKEHNNKYNFILRPDNTLDYSLELLNMCLK